MSLFKNIISNKYIATCLPKQPKAELSAWRGCFYIRLADSFDGICTTDVLERFDEYYYPQFLTELKKQSLSYPYATGVNWQNTSTKLTLPTIMFPKILATD